MPQSKPQNLENQVIPEEKTLLMDRFYRLLINLKRYAWDFLGIFCLSLSLMTLLALFLPELARGLLILVGRYPPTLVRLGELMGSSRLRGSGHFLVAPKKPDSSAEISLATISNA